jgi:hypothetical protein
MALCLRQGYECSCPQCQIWISRWEKEIESFAVVDKMMRKGKSLFQIYERLRAEFPDTLRFYHTSIEDQYIEFKNSSGDHPAPPPKKRIKLSIPPSPSPSLPNNNNNNNNNEE